MSEAPNGLGLVTPDEYSFADDDSLWEMAVQTKTLGNKYFTGDMTKDPPQKPRLDDAVSRYSEVIMQCRRMTDGGKAKLDKMGKTEKDVRELVQSCYLNLSACFLKMAENGDGPEDDKDMLSKHNSIHAFNSASRALFGDEDPLNPAHAEVLQGKQRVKALFRRASAGFRLLELEDPDVTSEETLKKIEAGEKRLLDAGKRVTVAQQKPSVEMTERDLKTAVSIAEKENEKAADSCKAELNQVNQLRRRVMEMKKKEKEAEKTRMKGFLGNKESSKEGKDGDKKDGEDGESPATKTLLFDGSSLEQREKAEAKRKEKKDEEVGKTVQRLQDLQIHKTLEQANAEGQPVAINADDKGKTEDEVFFDEITSQIHEMREANPEKLAELKEKLRAQCEEKGVMPEDVLGQ